MKRRIPRAIPRSLALCWAVAFILSGVAAVARAAEVEDLASRIDAYVRPFAEIGHLSGTLVVARADTILYEGSFGLADRELAVANSAETRYSIASITKPMTQIVGLRLIESGRLALDDPLAKWIPDFPHADEITVEMLARHRAGIPHRLTEPSEEAVPRTAADMVELARRAGLAFPPGEQTSYSSGGYSVLARVLELAGGKSYAELLDEYVFTPAGMSASTHPVGYRLIPHRADSYQFSGNGRLVNTPLEHYSFLVGAGSVFSTPRDLVRMMRAVVDGTYGELVRQQLLGENGIHWNGVTNGYRAFADYDPEGGLYVAFAGNIVTGAIDLLRRELPRLISGEAVEPPTPPTYQAAEVPVEVLERYEGDYELRPGSVLSLGLEAGEVRIGDWILIPTSETSFFSPQDYGRIEVILDPEGSVERLDWTVGGETYPMPRLEP